MILIVTCAGYVCVLNLNRHAPLAEVVGFPCLNLSNLIVLVPSQVSVDKVARPVCGQQVFHGVGVDGGCAIAQVVALNVSHFVSFSVGWLVVVIGQRYKPPLLLMPLRSSRADSAVNIM